jgi:hypothetical protein
MSNDATPDPVPVPPEQEPEQIFPSATGLVVPNEDDAEATTPDA